MCPCHRGCIVVATAWPHGPTLLVLYRHRCDLAECVDVVAMAWPRGPTSSLLRDRYDADNTVKQAYVPMLPSLCHQVGGRWRCGKECTSTSKASKSKCKRDGFDGWQ